MLSALWRAPVCVTHAHSDSAPTDSADLRRCGSALTREGVLQAVCAIQLCLLRAAACHSCPDVPALALSSAPLVRITCSLCRSKQQWYWLSLTKSGPAGRG